MSYTSKSVLHKIESTLIPLQSLRPRLILRTYLNYILGILVLATNFQPAVFPFAAVKRTRYPLFCKFDGNASS